LFIFSQYFNIYSRTTQRSFFIKSLIRSAIIIVGMFVFALGIEGIIDASQIRNAVTPRTMPR